MSHRALLAAAALALFGAAALAADEKAVKASAKMTEAWANAPTTPAKPSDIDALVSKELKEAGLKPAPLTTDEQFVRRVSLDLTGELPSPAEVKAFVADKDAQ